MPFKLKVRKQFEPEAAQVCRCLDATQVCGGTAAAAAVAGFYGQGVKMLFTFYSWLQRGFAVAQICLSSMLLVLLVVLVVLLLLPQLFAVPPDRHTH